jgi:hypothetical protein
MSSQRRLSYPELLLGNDAKERTMAIDYDDYTAIRDRNTAYYSSTNAA